MHTVTEQTRRRARRRKANGRAPGISPLARYYTPLGKTDEEGSQPGIVHLPGTVRQACDKCTVPQVPQDTARRAAPRTASPQVTLHAYLRHLNLESPFTTFALEPLEVLAVFLKLLVNMNGRRSCGLTGP